jgi:hypothetical protein
MNLNFTKVSSQIPLLLRRQVLIAEEHYGPFGNEKSEFVFLICAGGG